MTYGVCPTCGQVPKIPLEFVQLDLAARPVMILTMLYGAGEQRVKIDLFCDTMKISRNTLCVHISRIRTELRLCKLPWKIVRIQPTSYALVRSDDKDNSAKREEAPNT